MRIISLVMVAVCLSAAACESNIGGGGVGGSVDPSSGSDSSSNASSEQGQEQIQSQAQGCPGQIVQSLQSDSVFCLDATGQIVSEQVF